MRLYIANVTKQKQIVFFRIEFDRDDPDSPIPQINKPPLQLSIEPGRQDQVRAGSISGDLTKKQVDRIVLQLKPYGLLMESEVRELVGRRDMHVTCVANIDSPVSKDTIDFVMGVNHESKLDEGAFRRKQAAVAINSEVQRIAQQHMAQEQVPDQSGHLRQPLEVEFEQLEQSGPDDKRIEEGYRVDDKAPSPKQPPRGRGHRRAA